MSTDTKPAEKAKSDAQFEDGDIVTVLYGYGKVPADKKFYVDDTLFVGGIAKVPYLKAKHWQKGTRPDGKPVISRIHIQAILPEDANEADFARVTGIRQAIEPDKLGAFLGGLNANDILTVLGTERAKEFAQRLQTLTTK